ncbi:hypothetical protein EXIGLDRAFT_844329 [Exidia glandulosa HHB12029]|uniref:Transmembrane protein n=1 Tax=Exidia glandulosa HHB12029 TaxID=1314781 RepID=A0A165C3T4_EXIGL|nr:hypothetical protein EXIGLDRAFT_844329 [Exidia glandulosa HHB12029]
MFSTTYPLSALLMLAAVGVVEAGIQTEAHCDAAYSWMDNAKGQSPCLVAAYLLGACSADLTWDVGPINLANDSSYAPPGTDNPATFNPCGCSWAVYNLLQACAVCQGEMHIRTWPSWRMACTPEFLQQDTFFPGSPYEINSNTSVPYWATQNPVDAWDSATFNPSTARNLDPGHDDLTSVDPKHKTVSPGAIAGGVVAAIVVVVVAVLATLFVLRRRRQRRANIPAPGLMLTRPSLAHQPSTVTLSSRSRFSPPPSDYPRVISPTASSDPGTIPFMMQPSQEAGWPPAAPSSTGMYTPDPFILNPMSPTSNVAQLGHSHSHSDLSTSSGTVTMHVQRPKDTSAYSHAHSLSSSSSAPAPPPTSYRPHAGAGRYNPPPYSAAVATASPGSTAEPLPRELPALPENAVEGRGRSDSQPPAFQLVTPQDEHADASSTFPPEKLPRH